MARRALETAAIARWADLRNRSPYAGARELIAIGDFNMPKGRRARPAPRLPRPAERRRGSGGGDSSPAPAPELYNPVYDALTSRGLVVPLHSGLVGSSIASDNFYDQVALFPTTTKKPALSDPDPDSEHREEEGEGESKGGSCRWGYSTSTRWCSRSCGPAGIAKRSTRICGITCQTTGRCGWR